MLRLACAVALVCTLEAQTFVVDANSGPGTNFTSIAAAVAAVPDGSVLLVRPGTYQSFTINAKGLTVLGGGVYLTSGSYPGTCTIVNTQPGQTVAIRGLVLQGLQVVPHVPKVTIANCRGAVLLEDVDLPTVYESFYSLDISSSSQVMVRDCAMASTRVQGSSVTFSGCSLDGYSSACGIAGTILRSSLPALEVLSGDVTLLQCTLQGGLGALCFLTTVVPNQPALVCSGHARVLSPSSLTGGSFLVPPAPAAVGTGTFDIDPSAQLTPPPPTSLNARYLAMPTASSSSVAAGSNAVASGAAPSGSVAVLVVGLRGLPTTIPGVAYPFWMDPAAYYFAAFGVAPLQATVSVPARPSLVGQILDWQCVALLPSGLQASNPSWTLVR